MARIRGLEILFDLKRITMRSKADCLVAAMHTMLVNEGLQCVGIGEEFDATQDSTLGSELLPDRWNENQDEYNLRYTSRDSRNRCLFKAVSSGNILHANVIVNEHDSYPLSLDVNHFVTDNFKEYRTAYVDLEELIDIFNTEVLAKIREDQPIVHLEDSFQDFPKHPGPSSPRKKAKSGIFDIEDIDPPEFPKIDPKERRPTGYPRIGEKDLDPTGRGQGTMLFDPSENDPTPRSRSPKDPDKPVNVPPGARYDPIGPLKGPDKGKPNPDHFKPPKEDDSD